MTTPNALSKSAKRRAQQAAKAAEATAIPPLNPPFPYKTAPFNPGKFRL